MTAEFEIEGMKFVALNGGPYLQIQSIYFIPCGLQYQRGSRCPLGSNYHKVAGPALMELGSYPMSERYGWLQDKYGLSWQVMFVKDRG